MPSIRTRGYPSSADQARWRICRRGLLDGSRASSGGIFEGEQRFLDPELGIKGDWYVHAEDVEQLEQIEAGDFEPRTTLLSPSDNLICDRNRTLALWGLDFRLEIYVPKTRRWGYFVMPLLHGDRIIARFDLAADRKVGVLNVIGERWEPDWEGGRQPVRASKRALDELASFLGVGVRRHL